MVTKPRLAAVGAPLAGALPLALFVAFSLLFLAACGGSDSGSSSQTSSVSTRAPTASGSVTTGPTATLSPRNGPPGTELIVTGSGWPVGATVTVVGEAATPGSPYSTVTTNAQGAFTAQFRLEKQPNGADLQTGRFNLIARSGTTEVVLPFQVDTRRPVQGPGPGGG